MHEEFWEYNCSRKKLKGEGCQQRAVHVLFGLKGVSTSLKYQCTFPFVAYLRNMILYCNVFGFFLHIRYLISPKKLGKFLKFYNVLNWHRMRVAVTIIVFLNKSTKCLFQFEVCFVQWSYWHVGLFYLSLYSSAKHRFCKRISDTVNNFK